jgi:tetratricopeptide (TPR) repeat protein
LRGVARAWAAAASCAAAAAAACAGAGAPAASAAAQGGSSAATRDSPRSSRAADAAEAKRRQATAAANVARAEQEWQKGNRDEAIRLWEDSAPHLPDAPAVWLRAARARRAILDSAEIVRPEAETDAHACAADARKSWSIRFPAAAAAATRAEAVQAIGSAGAEALYLEAVCEAAAARARGYTPLVERRVELAESLRRASELAADVDECGPDRELGRLLAALPASVGGDLRQAKERLQAAIARCPHSVRNHVAYARTVAVKEQDRPGFEAQLHEALRLAPDDPDATDLLARETELFGPAEAAQPIPGGPVR